MKLECLDVYKTDFYFFQSNRTLITVNPPHRYSQMAAWGRRDPQIDVPEPHGKQPDGRRADARAAQGDLRDLLHVRHPHPRGRPILLHAVQGGAHIVKYCGLLGHDLNIFNSYKL